MYYYPHLFIFSKSSECHRKIFTRARNIQSRYCANLESFSLGSPARGNSRGFLARAFAFEWPLVYIHVYMCVNVRMDAGFGKSAKFQDDATPRESYTMGSFGFLIRIYIYAVSNAPRVDRDFADYFFVCYNAMMEMCEASLFAFSVCYKIV